MDFILALIAAVLGLAAGAAVNILADDLPEDRRPGAPRYPDGTPRPWLGIVAFLRGERRGLSWRYPVVEGVLAVSFAALVLAYPPDLQLIFYLFYAFIFMLVTVIDLEHRLILFVTMIPAAAVALLDAVLVPEPAPTLVDALAGGALGFGVFWLVWYGGVLFNKVRAKGQDPDTLEVAFGFGDVILAAVCGLMLGWRAMSFAMFITVFVGAFVSLIWVISRLFSRDGYAMFTALPYGPYIVFGTVMMLFFTEQLKQFFLPGWFI